MFKIIAIIYFLLLLCGCQPSTKYTFHEEYTEEQKWVEEKGLVKSYQATWKVRWEN